MKPRIVFAILLIGGLFFLIPSILFSQVGLSVSPPRVYYRLNPGETGSQKVLVSNISKEHPLHLSLSMGDWYYDLNGNNVLLRPDSLENSCASWITIPDGMFMTLEPGEKREIELVMAVPVEPVPATNVQTSMLYITQMNPVDGVDSQGAAIKVNVRQGIKIYRKGSAPEKRKVEIENLSYDKTSNSLLVTFKNQANIWLDGHVKTSLFNQHTGKESHIQAIDFFTMPGDLRVMQIPLSQELEQSEYTATIMLEYGDRTTIEAAELQFNNTVNL